MGYVDAHVHVWTDDYGQFPFASGHEPAAAKPTTFHAEDILGHANACGVDRVVLVQMSFYGDDNSYMLKVMGDHPGVFAGIGVVDPTNQAAAQQMKSLAAKGVCGFRVAARDQPIETWCDGEGFERMFAAAATDRLAICPLIGPAGLPALRRRCEQFPDTPVIIDHMCLVGGGGSIDAADTAALCAIAEHEQVMVKVSAFYALGEGKAPYDDLGGLIKRIVDAFGPQRLMWASDAPYQVQPPHEYRPSVDLIATGLDFLSSDDRQQILSTTAGEFFFRD
ncbi:MAG: amidohydrolase family protein [Gemmatimonadetes bacterium]|jgi:predicted TIM-barrel fold metal-dependent hydrolase|nr:amidohydrolase family protein [Gemmatimonadota bacterium]MBT5060658.1 amidohydrolase family protein [Gemmatimonadota bacterium]MBT5145432.1 amidohydrolase family protein [Gemmatimonadota bacterium]MBT5591620.1 amidohydrolase family protein [Gemmatimonadota bacterium]MBT5961925.1 amidohydrolase family protein [Gemmatimonadota bacterium]